MADTSAASSSSSSFPTSKKGDVDLERLLGVTPNQMRAAAKSYGTESKRLLFQFSSNRSSGSGSRIPSSGPESTTTVSGFMSGLFALGEGRDDVFAVAEDPAATRDLAFEYAAEARRLYAKADKLERKRRWPIRGGRKSRMVDLNAGNQHMVQEIYHNVNRGKITTQDVDEAVQMAALAASRAKERGTQTILVDPNSDDRYSSGLDCGGMLPGM